MSKTRQFQRKWAFTRAQVTPLQTATQLILSVTVIMAVVVFGFRYRDFIPEKQDLNKGGNFRLPETDEKITRILDMRDPSYTLSSSGKESVTAYLPHRKQTIPIRRPEITYKEKELKTTSFLPLETDDRVPAATIVPAAIRKVQNSPVRKSEIAVLNENGKQIAVFTPDPGIISSKPVWIKVTKSGMLSRGEIISSGDNRKFDTFCLDKITSAALPGGIYVVCYRKGQDK